MVVSVRLHGIWSQQLDIIGPDTGKADGQRSISNDNIEQTKKHEPLVFHGIDKYFGS